MRWMPEDVHMFMQMLPLDIWPHMKVRIKYVDISIVFIDN